MKKNNFSRSGLRIISGKWRGKKFDVLVADGLRPTTDRVRETLFNWLMHDIHGAVVADLFAGAGSLGLEALSRGAAHVCFTDDNPKAIAALKKIVSTLPPPVSAEVLKANALERLSQIKLEKPYDIVFVDPPFCHGLVEKTLSLLTSNALLSADAKIYVESETPLEEINLPETLEIYRSKKAGQAHYGLLCKKH